MEIHVKGLYQKRGWYYFTRMREGIRVFIALETKDLEEALGKVRKIQEEPDLLAPAEGKVEVEQFITYKLKQNEYSRFSAENKRLTLLRFIRWMGTTTVNNVKTGHIQKFYDSERERVKESTAQGYVMTLRAFFEHLIKVRRVCRTNPVADVRLGKWNYGKKVVFCYPEQRDLLLKGLETVPKSVLPPETVAMLGFVLHAGFEAGLRRNEIVEARPEWFNLKLRSMRVDVTDTFVPKDREKRNIPLTDTFLSLLEKYPFTGTWCIAPEVKRGQSRYRYDFIRPFKIYLDHISQSVEQDFRWVTPHIMRHTFASVLIHNGISLTKVSLWMGDDPRVTERHYAHLVEGDPAINLLRTQPLAAVPHTLPV